MTAERASYNDGDDHGRNIALHRFALSSSVSRGKKVMVSLIKRSLLFISLASVGFCVGKRMAKPPIAHRGISPRNK